MIIPAVLEVKAFSERLIKLYQRTGYRRDDATFQCFLRNFEAAIGDGLSNDALRGKLREYHQASPALKPGKASSPLTDLSHNFKVDIGRILEAAGSRPAARWGRKKTEKGTVLITAAARWREAKRRKRHLPENGFIRHRLIYFLVGSR